MPQRNGVAAAAAAAAPTAKLLLQREAFRCLALGLGSAAGYTERGADQLSLGLQLLLQASGFFLEADCTPLHLSCCRQAAVVALQLRAVELQLSRQSLQQQQQRRNSRSLLSQLLQRCSTVLEGSLHPFKDAEAFLKGGGTEFPLLSLPDLSESLTKSDSCSSNSQQLASTEDAAAEAASLNLSSWFKTLLFSLEESDLQWRCGRGASGEGLDYCSSEGGSAASAAAEAETAAAASRETAAAAAASDAVRKSEEAAAASVGLDGPYLQLLHLSFSQLLLFLELHPDAVVSGLTAQVWRIDFPSSELTLRKEMTVCIVCGFSTKTHREELGSHICAAAHLGAYIPRFPTLLLLLLLQAYQHIYGGVVQLAWPRAVYRQVVLGGRLSYLAQLLGRPLEQQHQSPSASDTQLRGSLMNASNPEGGSSPNWGAPSREPPQQQQQPHLPQGIWGEGLSKAALEVLVSLHLREFACSGESDEQPGLRSSSSASRRVDGGVERPFTSIAGIEEHDAELYTENFSVDADAYLLQPTGAAAAARAQSQEVWEALKAAAERNLLRLLQEALPNIRIRLKLLVSLGPSFSAAAAECCRLLDDRCLYMPQGFLSRAVRDTGAQVAAVGGGRDAHSSADFIAAATAQHRTAPNDLATYTAKRRNALQTSTCREATSDLEAADLYAASCNWTATSCTIVDPDEANEFSMD
ncbi:uncharacterized protein LOC34621433 [Cyclospora cayetanensis]|uniref:Uncharacterized protein LOC34621433 n=1 Tax=Cyclospora cayetanensis TaxID=88456 RepID=A0A6P6RTS6_9EIME|nr:uncharacterized protein LOC34621433 [Cyclospora cayetanensis]